MIFNYGNVFGSEIAQYFYLGVLACIVVATIIAFTVQGFFKAMLWIIRIAVLVLAFSWGYPFFNILFKKLGFIPATGFIGLSQLSICAILAVVAVLIVYIIFAKICKAIIKGAGQKINFPMNKFWGFIAGIPAAVVFSVLFVTVSSTSWIANKSEKMLENQYTQYYMTYVYTPVEEGLHYVGMPLGVEETMCSKVTEVKDPDFEKNCQKLHYTLQFFVDTETYINYVKNNNDYANAAQNMAFTLQVLSSSSGVVESFTTLGVVKSLDSWVSLFEGKNVDIGSAKDGLITYAQNLGCETSTLNHIYNTFAGSTIYTPVA